MFDKVFEQGKALIGTTYDNLRTVSKEQDMICVGDHNKLENLQRNLLESGTFKESEDFLHLEDADAQLLSWNEHPFLFGNLLLNTVQSRKILIYMADKMMKSASSWGGSIYSRDKPRYDRMIAITRKMIKE